MSGEPQTYSELLWAWPLLTRSLHSSYPLWVMSTSQWPRRKPTPGQSPVPLVSQLPSQPLVPQSQAQKQGVRTNPRRQKKRRGLMTSNLKILGQFKATKDAVKRLKYFFLHPRMLEEQSYFHKLSGTLHRELGDISKTAPEKSPSVRFCHCSMTTSSWCVVVVAWPPPSAT